MDEYRKISHKFHYLTQKYYKIGEFRVTLGPQSGIARRNGYNRLIDRQSGYDEQFPFNELGVGQT
jgi:hypothetical protein